MGQQSFGLTILTLLALVALSVVYSVWRGRRQNKIFQEVDRVTAQVNEFTLRVVELELRLSGYRWWNARLRGQVIELGGTPVAPPSWLTTPDLLLPIFSAPAGSPVEAEPPAAVTRDSTLVAVYDLLMEHFSLAEIDELAFRAHIDKDAFGGGAVLSGRAHALVMYAAKHLMMADLVREARLARPRIEWPDIPADNRFRGSSKFKE